MKHMIRRILACMMICFLLADSAFPSAAQDAPPDSLQPRAAELVAIQAPGTYDTVTKEQILNRLNAIRKEACDEGITFTSFGVTRTLQPSDYVPIEWSYELEAATMQRAAEARIHSDHTRPDGTDSLAYYRSILNVTTGYGENLAWNYSGIMDGIEQFYSEKKELVGQTGGVTGHYTSIINPDFRYTALSGFRLEEDSYYSVAQAFAQTGSTNNQKRDVSGSHSVNMSVHENMIEAIGFYGFSELNVGKSTTLRLKLRIANSLIYPAEVPLPGSVFTASPSGIVSIDGDTLTAIANGTVTVTGTSSDGTRHAEKEITCRTPVESVSLNFSETNLAVGESMQLIATVSPETASNKNVRFYSSSSAVTVDATGRVTVVSYTPSDVTIRVLTEEGSKQATCRVTVKVPITPGWKHDSKGWWYQYADGSYPKNKWEQIKSRWYYFDAAGYMKTGWLQQGRTWYYLKSSGEMATGWQKVGTQWYFFAGSGAMQTGWLKTGGKWYYLKSSGAMATGWQKVGGKWYYLESSGAMLANTSRFIKNKTYRFDANGVCTNP